MPVPLPADGVAEILQFLRGRRVFRSREIFGRSFFRSAECDWDQGGSEGCAGLRHQTRVRGTDEFVTGGISSRDGSNNPSPPTHVAIHRGIDRRRVEVFREEAADARKITAGFPSGFLSAAIGNEGWHGRLMYIPWNRGRARARSLPCFITSPHFPRYIS